MRRLGNAPVKDLVLMGAGDAHLEVLRRLAIRPEPGLRLTLIAREPASPCGGMLTGLIRGEYSLDESHIDLAPLAAASGARLILAEATGLDLESRSVALNGRPPIPFDFLSVNIGAESARPGGAGVPLKPIGRFLERLRTVESHLRSGGRLAIVGTGPAGTELALALASRFRAEIHLTLVGRAPEPLPEAPACARAVARNALVDAGVELVSGVAAGRYEHGRLALSDGSFLDADEVLWTANVVAPAFLAEAGLACDAAGRVRVDGTLRSLSHDFVFAAGDCATSEGGPRPKTGIWAVQAERVLARNLRRAARGKEFHRWRKPRHALVLLGLGGGRALGWRNGLAVHGAWVQRWKDRIDRRWAETYQRIGPTASGKAPPPAGGFGARIGTGVLAGLPLVPSPDIIVALQTPDDAPVLRPPPGMALVQTVDYVRAFIDDPYLFGAIAAAQALSGLHAIGATPWTALAMAAVASGKRRDDLAAMMQGAAATFEADGCALVGAHSAEAGEASLGFAVTGLVETMRIMRKAGLRAGDRLLLTKPIGTGVILAAQGLGRCKTVWLMEALASMRQTNAEAVRIFRDFGVRSCTDVASFGLAGHLLDMLSASGLSAVLRRDSIPTLPGARQLSHDGIASTLEPENMRVLRAAACAVRRDDMLAVDPQTSGGLLAGVAADQADACLAALLAAGLTAAIIGEVSAARDDSPRLRLLDEPEPP